jgi:hypothetical protein
VDVPTVDALNAAVERLFAIGFLRYNPAPWPGPTLADARSIVDPSLVPLSMNAAAVGTSAVSTSEPPAKAKLASNSIDDNIRVSAIGFTRFGAIAAYISNPTLSPESIRMVFAAYSWDVDIAEIITICAYIEIDPQKSLPRTINGKRATVDWNIIYKDAFPQIETQSLRIITMDEFIDGLALFNAVRNIVRDDKPLNKLVSWCEKVGLSYEVIVGFITSRDELIDHFLSNEFSVNLRVPKLAEAPAENYMEVVTRIKHCIYDGYRCDLLVMGEDGKYKSSTGISVNTPKFLAAKYKNIEMRGRVKPRYLIAQSIGVKYNRDVDIYEATPGLVSVMDGFVAVDLDFTI